MNDSRTPDWIERLVDGDPLDWPALARALGPESPALARMRRTAVLCAALTAMQQSDGGDGQGAVVLPMAFRWGHLQVHERLGSGATSDVHRAFDTVLGRDVALKLVAVDRLQNRAFLAEARRLAQVRHGHVLAVHGAAVHAGRAGLWADLIVGRSLKALVADEGPVPIVEVLMIGCALASALSAVHAAGLVHGDVKPSNVQREDGTGRIVLMDFGSAGSLSEAGRHGLLGSPLSMAPEQLRDEPVGPAVDSYGLGTVLFFLLAGRLPVVATSLPALAQAHADDAARVAALRLPAVPRALRQLLAELLSNRPQRRPDAAVALQRLQRIVDGPRRRRLWLATGSTIGALALALVASLFALQRVRQERAVTEAARAEQAVTGDFLIRLIAAPDPAQDGADIRVRDLLDRALVELEDRFDAHPAARLRLLRTIGNSYRGLGLAGQAQETLARALALSVQLHGADSASSLDLEAALAELAADLDPTTQGQQLLARVLARAEGLLGREHRVSVSLLLALAEWHRKRGELPSASTWAARALARRPQEPEIDGGGQRQAALIALGTIEWESGDLDRAEHHYRQALTEIADAPERSRWRGNELAARQNLAALLARRGHLPAAEAEFRRLIGQMEAHYGADHAGLRRSLVSFGGLLNDQGRHAEAVPHLERALALSQRHDAPGDPARLHLLGNLANALIETGAIDRARALREQAHAAALDEFGDDHPTALIMQNNLAEQRLIDGDAIEAERLASLMAERAGRRLGPDHLFTLEASEIAARARFASGRHDEALAQLRELCRRKRQVLGVGHPHSLGCRLHLAQALADNGQGAAARELLQATWDDSVAAHGRTHPLTARIERARDRWR